MLNWLRKILPPAERTNRKDIAGAREGAPSSAPMASVAESETFRKRGNEHLRRGEWTDAEECYRHAVSSDPKNADANINLGFVLKEQHRYDDAIPYLKQAILSNPAMVDAYYILGTISQEQGKLDTAIEHFNKVLTLRPDFEIAYRDLCYALFQSGQNEDAKKIIKKGIALYPDTTDFHYYLGNLYSHERDHDQAIASYQKALSLQPDYMEVLLNLGKALKDKGNLDEALACFRKALTFKPDYAEAHVTLGDALKEQGNPNEAQKRYQQALALEPDYFEARFALANILYEQNNLDEAVACYRQALTLQPDSAEAYNNLGNVFLDQGNLDDAQTCYAKAVSLAPGNAESHYNLGNIFQRKGNLNEAQSAYEKAISLAPASAESHHVLGSVLHNKGDLEKAAACHRKALELDPEFHIAKFHLLHISQKLCDWENLDSDIEAARRTVRKGSAKGWMPPFVFFSLPGTTLAEQRICAEQWTLRESKPLLQVREKLAFDFNRKASQRIRLGYLSPDFHLHATALLMVEVFELHDRNRFHITAYSYGPDDRSSMRKRLKNAFDEFVDISSQSYEEVAKKIHDDQIDILVDLKGHTQHSRSAILALRPAPIQVNYLGYPGTMGADFVDYLIADHFIIPPEQEEHYTERVVRLADCYQPNDRTRPRLPPPSRADCGLPENGVVFCCFNQTYKIKPQIFQVWCRLLTAVPGSVLWLLASNPHAEANLKQEAKKLGIDEHRLVMAHHMEPVKHLARLACADLFLDTLPVNAHTTCSDALWMGLPIITCVQETFPSRVAGSLLTAMGVPELVTYNLDDYFSVAVDLATDRAKREAIRNKIVVNRDTAPLFDSKRFTRNLEEAFIQMRDDLRKRS